MPKFWCRRAEDLPDEAIAQEAADEEEAAISFAQQWDIDSGDCPILKDEYPEGFEVVVSQTAKDQHVEDRCTRFSVNGSLIPHYSAEEV